MGREHLQKAIKCSILKHKEIIFGVNSAICLECRNQFQKQQVIDEIVFRKKLMEDTVRKLACKNIVADDMLTDKKTGEVSSP